MLTGVILDDQRYIAGYRDSLILGPVCFIRCPPRGNQIISSKNLSEIPYCQAWKEICFKYLRTYESVILER